MNNENNINNINNNQSQDNNQNNNLEMQNVNVNNTVQTNMANNMQQNDPQNSNETVMNVSNDNGKQKKTSKILIIAIIVVVVLIGVFCLNFFVISGSRKNVSSVVSQTFKSANKFLQAINKDTILEKGTITLSTNNSDSKALNGYSASYDLELDYKNKLAYLNLKFGDNEELFETEAYYIQNFIYLNLAKVTSTVLKIPVENFDSFFDKIDSYDDIQYILDFFDKSINNNISSSNLKNSVNGIGTKTTYTIDEKELKKLLKGILEDLLKDEKAIKIFEEKFSISKDLINELIAEFDEYSDESNEILFKIIIKKDFMGSISNVIFEDEESDFKIELNIDDINTMIIYADKEKIMDIQYNESLFKFKVYLDETQSLECDIKINNDTNKVNYDGYIKLSYDDEYIQLNLNNETNYNEKIKNIDISKAKDISELTDSDMEVIGNIILNLPLIGDYFQNQVSIINKAKSLETETELNMNIGDF